MCPANKRRRYNVTSSLIGWAHSQNDPCIVGATILVPCHVVESLQLIWRSGTRRWNLRVPDLQMSCSDLVLRLGTRIVVPVMVTRVKWHSKPFHMTVFNTLWLRHNSCHFAENVFKGIFVTEKFCILIQISLKIVLNGPIHLTLCQRWFR